MGTFHQFYCSKCGYQLNFCLGYGGFSSYKNYNEIFSSAKNGKFGEEIRKFLQENPDGKIDNSKILIYCQKC